MKLKLNQEDENRIFIKNKLVKYKGYRYYFGSNGKRYIRISLCCKDDKLAEALKRIKGMR